MFNPVHFPEVSRIQTPKLSFQQQTEHHILYIFVAYQLSKWEGEKKKKTASKSCLAIAKKVLWTLLD